jgi:hypothetical protein
LSRELKFVFLVLAFALFYGNAAGTHLVGGSMNYEFLSKSGNTYTYRVTLKIYRDCSSAVDFDETIKIGVYENVGALDLVNTFDFDLISKTSVEPPQGSNCTGLPSVCLEEGIYTRTISVSGTAFGYHLNMNAAAVTTR